MPGIFINATTARSDSRNNVVIHGEVCTIEDTVLANVDIGVLAAVVANVSTMTYTNSNVYYNVWNGITTDAAKLDQMNYVKDYFTNLGYGIDIVTNVTNNTSIQWNVSW